MKKQKFLFLIPSVFLFCGCIPLQNQEITELKGEIAQMQVQYTELQQKHADLYAKADAAFVTLDVVSASIYELQDKVSSLNQKIHDLEIASKKRIKQERVDAILPSDLYQNAYSDYSMAKYELAYKGFRDFIEKYPNAELAPQAQFYMGETYYSRNMWQEAIEEYRKIEQKYKRNELSSAGRLRIALCYEHLGRKDEAMNIYASIVKDFPQSSEALTAKDKIRIFNNAKKK